MLAEQVGLNDAISDVLQKFDNEVGSDGRALISSVIATRNTTGDE